MTTVRTENPESETRPEDAGAPDAAPARKVFVEPGDVVHRGEVFARANDSGAPDGCHLHFEVRAVGGGLETARWPRPLLGLAAR